VLRQPLLGLCRGSDRLGELDDDALGPAQVTQEIEVLVVHDLADQLAAMLLESTEHVLDVVDRAALAAWLTKFDDAHPVDLVIANAGISIDKDNSSLDDFSVVRKTLDVNVGGVLNTVEPLVARMMARV